MDSIEDLSIRERKMVAGVFSGKSVTAAARNAGYAAANSSEAAAILQKPRVKQALQEAMCAAGINDESLSRLMRRGLRARKTIYHQGVAVGSEPDYYARHQYLRTALEIRGDIGSRGDGTATDSWEEILVAIRAKKSSKVIDVK